MKIISLLIIGAFSLGLDAYVISGLIPSMSNAFHVSAAQMGQTVTAFTLCYALSAPICSTLLSGKPVRQILLIAMIIFTCANAASACATSFTALLIARAFAGVGAGLYAPMAVATAFSSVQTEQKGRAISCILGGMSMGTVFGVPMGLFIAQYSSWENTFWFVTSLGVLTIAGIVWKMPDFPVKTPPSLRDRIKILTDHKVAYTVSVTLLTCISSLGLYTYIAPVIQGHVQTFNITPYLWVWGVGGVMGSFSIGMLLDYFGHPKHFMAGILFFMSMAILAIPVLLPYSFCGFLPFLLWGMMGWSTVVPQQHTLLSEQPHHSEVVVALNSSVVYLGSAVGAALGGLVISMGVLPASLPYFAGAIGLLACLGQLMIIYKHRFIPFFLGHSHQ